MFLKYFVGRVFDADILGKEYIKVNIKKDREILPDPEQGIGLDARPGKYHRPEPAFPRAL